jgi:hypothetical protein
MSKKKQSPTKTVSKKPVKKAVIKKKKRVPPPKVDYLEEKWKSLRASVRVGPSVDRIWSGLLTEEERKLVKEDDSIGPDIVDIWAKLRGISASRAIVDLGLKLNLISDFDAQQLLKKLGEEDKPTGPALPAWDRSAGILRLGSAVVKRVLRLKKATNAIRILNSFQETGWPSRLDDPLTLNENLKLIRFRGDGTGKGIVWERI